MRIPETIQNICFYGFTISVLCTFVFSGMFQYWNYVLLKYLQKKHPSLQKELGNFFWRKSSMFRYETCDDSDSFVNYCRTRCRLFGKLLLISVNAIVILLTIMQLLKLC